MLFRAGQKQQFADFMERKAWEAIEKAQAPLQKRATTIAQGIQQRAVRGGFGNPAMSRKPEGNLLATDPRMRAWKLYSKAYDICSTLTNGGLGEWGYANIVLDSLLQDMALIDPPLHKALVSLSKQSEAIQRDCSREYDMARMLPRIFFEQDMARSVVLRSRKVRDGFRGIIHQIDFKRMGGKVHCVFRVGMVNGKLKLHFLKVEHV